MKELLKSSEETMPADVETEIGHADDTCPSSAPSGSSPPPSLRIPEHALDPVAQWLDSARGAISHNTERALRSNTVALKRNCDDFGLPGMDRPWYRAPFPEREVAHLPFHPSGPDLPPAGHAPLLEDLLNERVHLPLWGENHPGG